VSSAPAPDLPSWWREQLVVGASIALLVALSWTFLIRGAGMGAMQPPVIALLAMWWLMMAAMMLPSAAPAILLYARVRHMRDGDSAIAGTWVFLAGYLALWLLFSAAAVTAQRLITGPSMALDRKSAEAAVLIAAGVYQLSPLKGACLRQCRVPAQFISRHWRPGWKGTFRLGLFHGVYCVGCCWLLMALLFVGGVMNLAWIALLTLLVAAEKLLPGGRRIGQAAGVGFIAWGALVALS